MHSSVFHSLPTYGPLILLGMIIGLYIFRRETKHLNLDTEMYTDIIIFTAVAGFFGARLLQVVVESDIYLTSFHGFFRIFKLWEGGFAYLGGFLTGFSIFWFLRKHINFLVMMDLTAIPLAFAHYLGRIGCFMAGCCWGKPSRGYSGVQFPKESAVFQYYDSVGQTGFFTSNNTVPLHPTQLYEAFGNIIIVILLVIYQKRKRFNGHLALIYMLLYGILRFIVEIFRGDPDRGYLFKLSIPELNKILNFQKDSYIFLSTSQSLSLLLIIASSIILWYRLTKVS